MFVEQMFDDGARLLHALQSRDDTRHGSHENFFRLRSKVLTSRAGNAILLIDFHPTKREGNTVAVKKTVKKSAKKVAKKPAKKAAKKTAKRK